MVVVVGTANVEPVSCMQRLGGSCCGIVVNQYFCPERGKGYLLKSNWPLISWLAETRGLQQENRKRLSVSLTSGKKMSQICRGKAC